MGVGPHLRPSRVASLRSPLCLHSPRRAPGAKYTRRAYAMATPIPTHSPPFPHPTPHLYQQIPAARGREARLQDVLPQRVFLLVHQHVNLRHEVDVGVVDELLDPSERLLLKPRVGTRVTGVVGSRSGSGEADLNEPHRFPPTPALPTTTKYSHPSPSSTILHTFPPTTHPCPPTHPRQSVDLSHPPTRVDEGGAVTGPRHATHEVVHATQTQTAAGGSRSEVRRDAQSWSRRTAPATSRPRRLPATSRAISERISSHLERISSASYLQFGSIVRFLVSHRFFCGNA